MRQWLLAAALLPDSDRSWHLQHQGDVWWHQEGIGPNAKENCPFEINHRGGDSRHRTTDGALGRTLHWALSKGKCSHRRRPECHRVPTRAGRAWQRTNHRRTQWSPGLSCLWQTPGKDGIPAEVLKCCKETLVTELYEILCFCWSEGEVPQDMKDANVVTLYKNKGDRGDCNNYRRVSLLSAVGKVFARVILKKFHVLAEQVYLESQCGFRANRSTTDMIFSLRQHQEKCREQRQPLFVAFIDLTKAFDLVSRDGLFEILPKIGCPLKILSIIGSFEDMKGTVVFDGSASAAFNIRSGVTQGCVLAPTLFGIFFAVMLKHAFGPAAEGIYLRTRTDGKLFNLSRLWAKTKVQLRCLRDFLFADDAAATAYSAEDLQQLMTRFSDACQDFGLTISLKKSQVMGQDTDSPPAISINDHELDVIYDFVYMGSAISDTLSFDSEFNRRIGKAATTMIRLTKKAWNNSKLTLHTKIQIYRACVVSTLLYYSKSWTLRAWQKRKLNAFHMRSLRPILNITWQDKVPNNTVLERAGCTSMFTLLKQRRMPWLGHVVRMDNGRIPKDLCRENVPQADHSCDSKMCTRWT